MTLENLLSQMGAGTKQLTERYSEYGAPAHEQQLLYTYEPSAPVHGHDTVSKYNYGGGGHKSSAAMSALTLLAFLFFLHILQQCIKDHMVAMSTPQIMIMTAGREGETALKKSDKLDKSGLPNLKQSNKIHENELVDDRLTRINTAEPPKIPNKSANRVKSYNNRSLGFSGFVSAMGDV